MVQEIIVYAIGVAVAVYVILRIVRLITRRSNPCAGCSGCDLKEELRKAAARKKECGKHTDKDTGSGDCSCGCD